MDLVNQKLQTAKRCVINEFGDAVVAIIVMGSITREATEASDLDVSIIYHDRDYNGRIEDIRDTLGKIADQINHGQPHHQLVLWASKEDHYRTNLPDVSYVRRNLPYALDRLDAWCGLAKNTLANYELASHRIIYGKCDALLLVKKIFPCESLELFIIATRTFAEGIAELASIDVTDQRNGVNHIAKAGLRAAYAVLISRNTQPLNSYRAILEASILTFPCNLHNVLKHLYELKTGRKNELIDIASVLQLMHYCEKQISTVRRLSMSEVAFGTAGESFAFPNLHEELMNDPPARSEEYRRFAGFEVNYIHSLYFLMTATEIVRRFARAAIYNHDILNFFFEEITTIATFAIYAPFGTRIRLGIVEMTELQISLGIENREMLPPLLSSLKKFYEVSTNYIETPWLPYKSQLSILETLALVAPSVGIGKDDTELAALTEQIDIDALCYGLRWQSQILARFYCEKILGTFNQLALLLYQTGRNDDAREILQELLWIDNQKTQSYISLLDQASSIRLFRSLSLTRQYLGITYQRSGDAKQAKYEYLRSLKLDPDNYSALDDLTSLLMSNDPNEATVSLLSDLVITAVDCRKESQENVSQRFMNYAIKCKQEGNYSDADIWYRHTLKFNPESYRANFNYGLLLEQVGEIFLAEQHYEKAIALNPQYTNAYVQLALSRESQKDFQASIDLLNIVVNTGLADEKIWTNLGNSYLGVNDLELARKCFVEALKINDCFADAWNGLGVILIFADAPSLEDLIEALFLFQKAIETDPSFEGAKINYLRTFIQLTKLSGS